MSITTKKLGNYILDIIRVQDFKEYYYDNKENFNTTAMNAFLKALDIPPRFFKEQPEETQKELLDNREYFVAEKKKYTDKVIVILRAQEEGEILNACRMASSDADKKYEALSSIDGISNKFEHRSFIKDGYTSIVISNDIKKGIKNNVLVVDFPVLLNKKPIIHKAFYALPDDTFATAVEHIQYIEDIEIEIGENYNTLKEAIEDNIEFLDDTIIIDNKNILREPDVIAIALVQLGIVPEKYLLKIQGYMEKNTKGVLTTEKLESLVLDFDEEFRKYKQVTSLRGVSGNEVLDFLNSDDFKAIEENLKTSDLDLAIL